MSERIKREVVIPENRGFKGVWIPGRLYLTREFTPNEKFVLIEIYSLTRKDRLCYATNKHFSDFVGLSESAIKKMMAKFEKLGYISRTIEYKNGSKEIIRRFIKLTNKFYESFVNETEIPEENADGKADDGGGEKSPRGGGEKSPRVGEKSIQISNTDIKCNSISSNTDSNKVFSQEEKTSYNKAFSEEKAYRSPDISYEYTEKEFKEFITKKVDHIVKEISPEEYDASVEPISAIIAYFYKRYYKCMGKRHPILTDAVYTKIIMKLIEPVEDIWKRDFRLDKTVYYAMIDQFFKTDYGVKSGNITDYRMSYFMSDTVQSNLVYRSGII